MNKKDEIKKLERKARILLLQKEIPADKVDHIKDLLKHEKEDPERCYLEIIDILKNCPEKKVQQKDKVDVKNQEQNENSHEDVKHENVKKDSHSISGPIGTSEYVNVLYKKYKALKIFKKKWLVHRNNRFGLGLRKRLVPTKRLIKVFKFIGKQQEVLALQLNHIIHAILKNSEITDPTEFNYLRQFRKWIFEIPFKGQSYDTIKWLEQKNFDKEFKPLIKGFFSFLRIQADSREEIIIQLEETLRSLEGYKKKPVLKQISITTKKEIEKFNLEIEKKVFNYLALLRSFLPTDPREDNILNQRLKEKFLIENFAHLLLIIAECLIFERPFHRAELLNYYDIITPIVSSERWDYNPEKLKKFGKGKEAKDEKIKELKGELSFLQSMKELLNSTTNNKSILAWSLEEYWKLIEKKEFKLKYILNERFELFCYHLIKYFFYVFVPFLDGSLLQLRDEGKQDVSGSIFLEFIFQDEIAQLKSILGDIESNQQLLLKESFSKTKYETEIINYPEIEKESLSAIVYNISEVFYSVSSKLMVYYESHKRWVLDGARLGDTSVIRNPMNSMYISEESYKKGKPITFYDCTFKDYDNRTILLNEFIGIKILENKLNNGIFYRILSFSLQLSYILKNENVIKDIKKIQDIKQELELLKNK